MLYSKNSAVQSFGVLENNRSGQQRRQHEQQQQQQQQGALSSINHGTPSTICAADSSVSLQKSVPSAASSDGYVTPCQEGATDDCSVSTNSASVPVGENDMLSQVRRLASVAFKGQGGVVGGGGGYINRDLRNRARDDSNNNNSPWAGILVARVIPERYVEYDVRKPPCRIDPVELLLLSTQQGQLINNGGHTRKKNDLDNDGDIGTSKRPTTPTLEVCKNLLALSSFNLAQNDEDELVVSLDVDLFRQQDYDSSSSMNGDDTLIDKGETSERDTNRDHGMDRSKLGGEVGTANDATSASDDDDGNGDGGGDGDGDSLSEQSTGDITLHLHLNRKASESAVRTLRRLEISTAKRIQSELPKSGRGKQTRKKLPRDIVMKDMVSTSTVMIQPSQSFFEGGIDCSVAEGNDNAKDGSASTPDEDGCSSGKEWDVSDLTSAEMWKRIATEYESDPQNRGRVSISLSLPQEDEMAINLDVIACPPTILEVQTFENFDARVFVGVPLVIGTKLIYASHAVVTWFVDGVEVLRDNKCYTPTEADVGKEVSVLLIPVRPGHDGSACEEAYKFHHRVEPLPFMPIVSPIRDEWRARSDESRSENLRVLTYNILADLYTSRDIDKQLMYSHCNLQHLMRWRRMPMLVAEILAYNADIICLQEVDALVYDTLLRPVLEAKGYQGFYSNKVSDQREGCAMFWSLQCFERAEESDMHTFSIRDLFSEEESRRVDDHSARRLVDRRRSFAHWDSMHGITDLMDKHDELRRVTIEKIGQILQLATLTLRKHSDGPQHQRPEKIVLANTHLFYHPMADHIRAMQAYVICKQIDAVRRRDTPYPYPIVFCGDLNSGPLSGAVQLLFTRRLLPEHHDTWKHLNEYVWEMGDNEYMIEHGYVGNDGIDFSHGKEPQYIEESFDDAHEDEGSLDEESEDSIVHPPPIVLPSSFPNLVSGCGDIPPFTNYAVDFVETLDYVLVSEPSRREPFGLGPKRSAPMPSEEEVKRYVAMPNEFMPSDHVSIVCDLEWKIYDK